jgi:tRNA(Ile)-lysidine synthase
MAGSLPSFGGEALPPRVAVAFSGGRDSTALLHAVWRLAGAQGLEVHALHVHHGLSPNADAWESRCRAQCWRWSRRGAPIHFQASRLGLAPPPGASIEAIAREARYAALADMAHAVGCRLVLLAHHAQDQAETFLLQALRGAGAAGLAAMPAQIERGGILWCRPWLALPREAVEAYVRRYRLGHVEDESNASPVFARNRLRLEVWPALSVAFPQAAKVLGRAARHAQDAAACLDALARADLQTVARPGGGLDIGALRALGGPRLRNVLRLWLHEGSGHPATAALLERLSAQLSEDRPGTWQVVTGWQLRCRRGELQLRMQGAALGRGAVPDSVAAPLRLRIDGAGWFPAPAWSGGLQVDVVACGGVPLSTLGWVELRPRQGGEQFQRAAGTPPRALKKQFQSAGVPAWARDGPLVYDALGQLLYVPGLGLDARAVGDCEGGGAPEAVDGGLRVSLAWRSDPPT